MEYYCLFPGCIEELRFQVSEGRQKNPTRMTPIAKNWESVPRETKAEQMLNERQRHLSQEEASQALNHWSDMEWMEHQGSLTMCMLQKTKQDKQIDVLMKIFHY